MATRNRPRSLGLTTIRAEDMPEIAANTLSIAFSSFRRGYTAVDHLSPPSVIARSHFHASFPNNDRPCSIIHSFSDIPAATQ